MFPAWFLSPRTGAQGVERFGPTFDVIVAAVVTFILLFHAVTLGTVLGWPAWTAQVFAGLVGVGMAIVGNIMPRTRPNWVAGLRTKRTLTDPDVWRRTHRWFGGLLMASGLAVVIVAALVSAPAALMSAGVGALASALVATIVGARGPGSASSNPVAALLLGGLAVAMPLGAQEQRSFGYVWIVGQDTVGVERVTVQDSLWTSDLSLTAQARVIWSAPFVNGRFGPVDVSRGSTPAGQPQA